jgi:hypothetical protein
LIILNHDVSWSACRLGCNQSRDQSSNPKEAR